MYILLRREKNLQSNMLISFLFLSTLSNRHNETFASIAPRVERKVDSREHIIRTQAGVKLLDED